MPAFRYVPEDRTCGEEISALRTLQPAFRTMLGPGCHTFHQEVALSKCSCTLREVACLSFLPAKTSSQLSYGSSSHGTDSSTSSGSLSYDCSLLPFSFFRANEQDACLGIWNSLESHGSTGFSANLADTTSNGLSDRASLTTRHTRVTSSTLYSAPR